MTSPSFPPSAPSGAPMSTGNKIGLGVVGCAGALIFAVVIGSCAAAVGGGGSDTAAPAPAVATVMATVTATATETEETEVEVEVTATETVTVTETVTERADSGGGGGGGGNDDDGGAPVYYQNCDAARAAGAAPVRRGDPGYGSHLDRDGDGVGCE
ncbi:MULTISPECIES: excalibur calcium-binding domain-containing protein [unclassified Nocardiopsis]|uniref:excalibur calcium-binding domain-containing protein n=1 Tax=Nocardiopsis TaxID=2013 RepID=UPI00387A96D2